ncbi:glycoside hydrolase family 65 protein [Vagococcus sp. DIV0080]|uniref:Glycoside hydrolase family 65 protein n=1 Tax=Candidatus Vagococcus giribetii TaxID=2230876 RepID=A0ABS3HPH0_9ENTE|nr:glycoside hydrolase family 65 protein [Vagococcus sp. DIV0080]MBO0475643.1 glycoside hydrolase family 65 protein [Vagococcus sp. DIV0080]
MEHLKRLFDINPWKLATNELHHSDIRLQESLTSTGNGYMGMRGNFEEGFGGDNHQGTYIAGVWYPDKTRVGWWKNGYPDYFGKVINAINFIGMDIFINDHQIDLNTDTVSDFYQELDMEHGMLSRHFTIETSDMTVKFSFKRFLSLTVKELGVIRMTAEVIKGSGSIKVVSKLDNNVHNEDSNYDEMFWEEIAVGEGFVTAKTIPNNFDIEQFTLTALMENHATGTAISHKETAAFLATESFIFDVKEHDHIALEKQVIIVTSRDIEESKQLEVATSLMKEVNELSLDEHQTNHALAWEKRWEIADVVIEGDDEAQQGIRFNLFQLFSTYYGEDERLNIGPKGFTGEKYGGATYWDTEAYAVPLYLALADPSVTKNLLKYRHNQLPQAHHNARQQGLKGALYPMVTFTGVECHNEWEITFEEIHRNGSIAYAIYNYTNYTGDTSYIKQEGLEVLTEISRFWADRVHYSKRNKQYMMHGVTGPNEYENNVNNNWYTNYIAIWVLKYTLENYRRYQQETAVQISEEEMAHWEDIIANMYFPKDDELGVFVQHDTFLDKELIPVTDLDPKDVPLNQNWSWDHILRSCFIKQADVLQGIYYFNNDFTMEEKRRNFEFYEPMTVHESSLSPCIHSILAAELGMEEKAVEMYQRTARLDLDNYNNDTEDGLHITSMTGSWLAIVQGFAQMKTYDETLSFSPFLPKKWSKYAFHINYRGRLLHVLIDSQVTITLLSGEPIDVTIYNKEQHLTDTLTVAIEA